MPRRISSFDHHPSAPSCLNGCRQVVANEIHSEKQIRNDHVTVSHLIDDPGVRKTDPTISLAGCHNKLVQTGPKRDPPTRQCPTHKNAVGLQGDPPSRIVVVIPVLAQHVTGITHRHLADRIEKIPRHHRSAVPVTRPGPSGRDVSDGLRICDFQADPLRKQTLLSSILRTRSSAIGCLDRSTSSRAPPSRVFRARACPDRSRAGGRPLCRIIRSPIPNGTSRRATRFLPRDPFDVLPGL